MIMEQGGSCQGVQVNVLPVFHIILLCLSSREAREGVDAISDSLNHWSSIMPLPSTHELKDVIVDILSSARDDGRLR